MTCSKCKNKNCIRCQKVITEEIGGKISQKCNSEPKVIWRAIGIQPSGSIKVINTSNCTMIIKIKSGKNLCTSTITILPKDEIALTVNLIQCIQVECEGVQETDICTGCFRLCIHYLCKALDIENDCYNDSNDECKLVLKYRRKSIPSYCS